MPALLLYSATYYFATYSLHYMRALSSVYAALLPLLVRLLLYCFTALLVPALLLYSACYSLNYMRALSSVYAALLPAIASFLLRLRFT